MVTAMVATMMMVMAVMVMAILMFSDLAEHRMELLTRTGFRKVLQRLNQHVGKQKSTSRVHVQVSRNKRTMQQGDIK